jgi:hypothetical protein
MHLLPLHVAVDTGKEETRLDVLRGARHPPALTAYRLDKRSVLVIVWDYAHLLDVGHFNTVN